MTPEDFTARLQAMNAEQKEHFSATTGYGNSQWPNETFVTHFVGDTGYQARVCHFFGVPSQADRVAAASLASAHYAWLAYVVAVIAAVIAVASLIVSILAIIK